MKIFTDIPPAGTSRHAAIATALERIISWRARVAETADLGYDFNFSRACNLADAENEKSDAPSYVNNLAYTFVFTSVIDDYDRTNQAAKNLDALKKLLRSDGELLACHNYTYRLFEFASKIHAAWKHACAINDFFFTGGMDWAVDVAKEFFALQAELRPCRQ